MQGVGSLDTAINPQIASVRPSKTMVMTDLAREMRESGVDVIALTAGEPDFDTPAPILEAGREALRCTPARAPLELQHQRLCALRVPLKFRFRLQSSLLCSRRCLWKINRFWTHVARLTVARACAYGCAAASAAHQPGAPAAAPT
jgi:hypothetical protein